MGGFKLIALMVSTAMVVATMQFHGTTAQTTHVVGGALGWAIPPIGPFAYPIWTAFQTFTVGDNLVFNFTTGQHTVAEVSPADYNSCNTTNPTDVLVTAPVTVTLTTPGQRYYICTVGAHCQLGQKLAVNVVAGNGIAPSPVESP